MVALTALLVAPPIAAQTVETTPDPKHPEIVRRDSSVTIPFPTPPREIASTANEYRTCIMSSMVGKELIPPLEPVFEEGIQSCAQLRAQAEGVAHRSEVAGWPAAGTRERAAEVTELFDAIDEAHRSAARAMEEQFAQPLSIETEHSNAPDQ